MAWMKTLQCKSKAYDDVKHQKQTALIGGSCRKSVQSIKDVIESTNQLQKPKKKKKSKKPENKFFPDPVGTPQLNVLGPDAKIRQTQIPDGLCYPALTELPEGHPSRNVVEIIFHSGWAGVEPGRVEVMFKVQNLVRTVTRFEEYRERVKSRAAACGASYDERCVADGNEVMGFHSLGAYGGACSGAWDFPCSGKGIVTYSGSWHAHESASGGKKGTRAMMVCRVVAGRVGKRVESGDFDSVSGDKGELLVLDSRAVLPCFLIIYKL